MNFLKEKSFTLIEVLISISIIILMTSILLPSYQKIREDFALLRSAQKLAQDLRRVREMAISTKECCESPPIIPSGYGIWLEGGEQTDTSYTLYADRNGNEKRDVLGDTDIEQINLEKEVYILSPNNLSVNFSPPDPATKITSGSSLEEIEIILTLKADTSKTKKVVINKAGLIGLIFVP